METKSKNIAGKVGKNCCMWRVSAKNVKISHSAPLTFINGIALTETLLGVILKLVSCSIYSPFDTIISNRGQGAAKMVILGKG